MNNHVGEERSEICSILLTVGAPDVLVTEEEVFERGENHAVDVNVEKVDDVVEGTIEGTVGFFSVKLDDDDKDIVEQCEKMEVSFKLNNLGKGENISSMFSTKAGKCVPIETILLDKGVDGPAELDEVGDVDHGEEETHANSSVVNCKKNQQKKN